MWQQTASWGTTEIDVSGLITDALSIESRMRRGVNLDSERIRYTLCCAGIEAEIRRIATYPIHDSHDFDTALSRFLLPTIEMGQEYLDFIGVQYAKEPVMSSEMRLGASIYLPENIQEHITAYADCLQKTNPSYKAALDQRTAFFRMAMNCQCGVVELVNPFVHHADNKQECSNGSTIVKLTDLVNLREGEEETPDGEGAQQILHEEIYRALEKAIEKKQGSVNFSNSPHSAITEELNQFTFIRGADAHKPTYIQVIYSDGSQALDIPLDCLPDRSQAELDVFQTITPLRASLLSMRHLEMDSVVDFSWLRNREVSKSRTFAETDGFCYRESKRLFESTRDRSPFRLHVYQTGLQPAVVGFYRALIEELYFRKDQPASLLVIPYYFGKRGYRTGTCWY
jgi:hypothetical protein